MFRSVLLGLAVGRVSAVVPLLTTQEGTCTIDAQGCMLSPNYPNPYTLNHQCTIKVTGAEVRSLRVDDFHTEVFKDVLTINNQAYSGDFLHALVLDAAGGFLQWTSGNQEAGSGWHICPAWANHAPMWTVSGPCSLCPSTKCITSPNFPMQYALNQQCTIEYPANFGQVTVKHFDVRKGGQLGTLAGGIQQFLSVTPGQVIQWFSDDNGVSNKGWKICPQTVVVGAQKAASVCPGVIKAPAPLESMPLNVNAQPLGRYSKGDGAAAASQSAVLPGVAALVAVARFAAGWLAHRRHAAMSPATQGEYARTLEA